MGLIDVAVGLFNGVKKIFGSSSKSNGGNQTVRHENYNYDPDKVRAAELEVEAQRDRLQAAEIERDMQLRLADKEAERIQLAHDAQRDIIQLQTESQIAIEEARAKGMTIVADQLVKMQERMLDVARKRLMIIEEGAMPIVREIEAFYNEVGDRIRADADEYNTKKLPLLLDMLGRYERGTPQFEIFFAQINDDRARQNQFVLDQMTQVQARQNLVLQSFLSSKERLIEQTGQLTQAIAMKSISLQLEGSIPPNNYIGNGSGSGANQIGGRENKLLPSHSGADR